MRVERAVPRLGHASVRLPHTPERPHEVTPAALRLERLRSMPGAEPHLYPVPEPHLLRPPARPIHADRAHGPLQRQVARLVERGEAVGHRRSSVPERVSRVGDGVLRGCRGTANDTCRGANRQVQPKSLAPHPAEAGRRALPSAGRQASGGPQGRGARPTLTAALRAARRGSASFGRSAAPRRSSVPPGSAAAPSSGGGAAQTGASQSGYQRSSSGSIGSSCSSLACSCSSRSESRRLFASGTKG